MKAFVYVIGIVAVLCVIATAFVDRDCLNKAEAAGMSNGDSVAVCAIGKSVSH